MHRLSEPPTYLLFGAKLHDASYWLRHGQVKKVESHFDGSFGWLSVELRGCEHSNVPPATYVDSPLRPGDPDLYVWGEGVCPVSFFEHAPDIRKVLIFLDGPTAEDTRRWWSVGIWLE